MVQTEFSDIIRSFYSRVKPEWLWTVITSELLCKVLCSFVVKFILIIDKKRLCRRSTVIRINYLKFRIL